MDTFKVENYKGEEKEEEERIDIGIGIEEELTKEEVIEKEEVIVEEEEFEEFEEFDKAISSLSDKEFEDLVSIPLSSPSNNSLNKKTSTLKRRPALSFSEEFFVTSSPSSWFQQDHDWKVQKLITGNSCGLEVQDLQKSKSFESTLNSIIIKPKRQSSLLDYYTPTESTETLKEKVVKESSSSRKSSLKTGTSLKKPMPSYKRIEGLFFFFKKKTVHFYKYIYIGTNFIVDGFSYGLMEDVDHFLRYFSSFFLKKKKFLLL